MNARIVLEFPQAPEAKEIELLVALAGKFNGVMIESSNASKSGQRQDDLSNIQAASLKGARTPSLHLGIDNFPQDLGAYAVTPEQLNAIANIFDDEPSAEALCELLTP